MGHCTQSCLGSRPLSLSAWFLSVGEAPAVTGQPPAQPVSMVTDASSQLGLGVRPGGWCQGALGQGWAGCFMVRHLLLLVPSHRTPTVLAFRLGLLLYPPEKAGGGPPVGRQHGVFQSWALDFVPVPWPWPSQAV